MSDYIKTREEKEKNKEKHVELFQKMIVASEQMKNIVRLVDMVKDTEITILIEGETGVGKNVLARYIHSTSNRGHQKIMEINCGAIPAQLLESELFGYVSGAFTGADRKGKAGLLEICDGGTIVLDEISDIPFSLQVKLLHVLQNKTITRVGGTKERPIDVRVIAATNRPLKKLVEKGEFREDLYYRLNVVPIVIPPLRERKDAILPAAQYFVEKYTKLYGKKLELTKEVIACFQAQPWRGNLRELENCIERLVVTEGTREFNRLYGEKNEESGQTAVRSASGGKTLGDMEKTAVLEAYARYGSSYKVAEALGISQSSAYRKIKKFTREEQGHEE